MNRLSSPLLKTLLVTSLTVFGGLPAATAAPAATTAVKADPAKGGALYDAGDAARGLPACVTCHGAAGNSSIAVNPKLSGQFATYTHKQLVDFTTPGRQQPIMTLYAKMLTAAEKQDIAAWLATQAHKPGAAKNKDTVELGRKIYRGGIAERGVAACASCHGATANGIPAQYPRLAGQHQDYTTSQLEAFKSGARANSPQMTTLTQRMSTAEMRAVADYIAGLR
jgi:cytochrome c553